MRIFCLHLPGAVIGEIRGRHHFTNNGSGKSVIENGIRKTVACPQFSSRLCIESCLWLRLCRVIFIRAIMLLSAAFTNRAKNFQRIMMHFHSEMVIIHDVRCIRCTRRFAKAVYFTWSILPVASRRHLLFVCFSVFFCPGMVPVRRQDTPNQRLFRGAAERAAMSERPFHKPSGAAGR